MPGASSPILRSPYIIDPCILPTALPPDGEKGQLHVDGDGVLRWYNGSSWKTTGPDPRGIQVWDVQLSHAQLLALHATPVPAIPAPAANQVIHVMGMILVFDPTYGAYTGNAFLGVQYQDPSVTGVDYNVAVTTPQNFLASDGIQTRTTWPLSGSGGPDQAGYGMEIGNFGDALADGGVGNSYSIRFFYIFAPTTPTAFSSS